MSAFLKVYTDSGHTSEVAHTTQNATTIATSHAVSAGDTTVQLTSTSGMPTQGYIDVIDGTNGNETLAYYGLSGNVINISPGFDHKHLSRFRNVCIPIEHRRSRTATVLGSG
jgi:hypothetical protein